MNSLRILLNCTRNNIIRLENLFFDRAEKFHSSARPDTSTLVYYWESQSCSTNRFHGYGPARVIFVLKPANSKFATKTAPYKN